MKVVNPNIEKTEFRYTGEKSSYRVKWNKMTVIPEIENGRIHFIIMTDTERINVWENDLAKVEEYAKKKIWARGRGADAYGRVRVLVRGIDKKEQLVGIVEKDVHRYYEPVTRFKKRKKV